MIALKPILHAWLEEAETQTRNKRRDPEAPLVLPAGEKKRKRTSIAAPEKRSLEAKFAVRCVRSERTLPPSTKTRPQKERRLCLVLQPTTETEAHEILRSTIVLFLHHQK